MKRKQPLKIRSYKEEASSLKKAEFREIQVLVDRMVALFGASKSSELLQQSRKNLYNIRNNDFVYLKDENTRKLRAMCVLHLTHAELQFHKSTKDKRIKEIKEGVRSPSKKTFLESMSVTALLDVDAQTKKWAKENGINLDEEDLI